MRKLPLLSNENALEQLVEGFTHARFHQSMRNDAICLQWMIDPSPTIDSWFSHIRCLQMGHLLSDYTLLTT